MIKRDVSEINEIRCQLLVDYLNENNIRELQEVQFEGTEEELVKTLLNSSRNLESLDARLILNQHKRAKINSNLNLMKSKKNSIAKPCSHS